jgi:hypothetical protein
MLSQDHTDSSRAQASSHRAAILTSAGQVPGVADDGNVAGLVAGYQFQRYIRFHRQKVRERFPDGLDTSHWALPRRLKIKVCVRLINGHLGIDISGVDRLGNHHEHIYRFG